MLYFKDIIKLQYSIKASIFIYRIIKINISAMTEIKYMQQQFIIYIFYSLMSVPQLSINSDVILLISLKTACLSSLFKFLLNAE